MGKRKDRFSRKERKLARLTHLEDYLTTFLKTYSTPTERWPKVGEALEEVARERLLLSAEVVNEDGFPERERRQKMMGA